MYHQLCPSRGKAPAPAKGPGWAAPNSKKWKFLVGLGRQLRFQDTISVTTLRPDIVLMSMATKQLVLLELTVPWEEWLEEVQKKKRASFGS